VTRECVFGDGAATAGDGPPRTGTTERTETMSAAEARPTVERRRRSTCDSWWRIEAGRGAGADTRDRVFICFSHEAGALIADMRGKSEGVLYLGVQA
jgi:hypothetical protein